MLFRTCLVVQCFSGTNIAISCHQDLGTRKKLQSISTLTGWWLQRPKICLPNLLDGTWWNYTFSYLCNVNQLPFRPNATAAPAVGSALFGTKGLKLDVSKNLAGQVHLKTLCLLEGVPSHDDYINHPQFTSNSRWLTIKNGGFMDLGWSRDLPLIMHPLRIDGYHIAESSRGRATDFPHSARHGWREDLCLERLRSWCYSPDDVRSPKENGF